MPRAYGADTKQRTRAEAVYGDGGSGAIRAHS